MLSDRFLQRRDIYARQLDDGGYVATHKPLQAYHLIAHLKGEITLGTYLLNPDSRGRFLVLDADDDLDWRRLTALARVLAGEGAPGYLEHSRRGRHLWFFLPMPLSGRDIRAFGCGLLAFFGIENIELFPKQDQLETGPGSLMRLPFGIHRKSGRLCGFYLPDGEPSAPTLREQIYLLQDPETVSTAAIERFRSIYQTRRSDPLPGHLADSRRPSRRRSGTCYYRSGLRPPSRCASL